MQEKWYTFKTKKQPNSTVQLSILFFSKKISEVYNEQLHEIQKKAILKGFRKGKAPSSLIEKNFGSNIKYETLNKLVEITLPEILSLTEEKPLPYAQPEADSSLNIDDLVIGNDFTFTCHFDTHPTVVLPTDWSTIHITIPNVEPQLEDINQELQTLQERNAIHFSKQEAVTETDEIHLSLVELDANGNEISNSKRSGVKTKIGESIAGYTVKETLKGVKKGETLTMTVVTDTNKSNSPTTLQVHIEDIKGIDIPDIDDEFAQDVSATFKNVADLKQDIQKKLEKKIVPLMDGFIQTMALEELYKRVSVIVPKSAITYQLHLMWNNFVSQFGQLGKGSDSKKFLQDLEKNKDKMLEHWQPEAEKEAKNQFILYELKKQFSVSIDDNELKTKLSEHYDASKVDELYDLYKNQDMLDSLRQSVEDTESIKLLQEKITVTKNKNEHLSIKKFEEYIQQKKEKSTPNETP